MKTATTISKWLVIFLLSCLATMVFIRHTESEVNAAVAKSPVLEKHAIEHDETSRSYYLRLPAGFTDQEVLPVIFVLHGGGRADGKDVASHIDFGELADRDRFIVVYPNGVNRQWNDGRGASARKTEANKHVDDVAFLGGLIDHIVAEYHADASRIYFTGASNGGMMSHRIGCELSHKVAAIAPIIANIPQPIAQSTSPSAKMPVLIINSTEDNFVPWDGGDVTVFRRKHGRVISTQESIDYWRNNNGLSDTVASKDLTNLDPNDGSTVHVTQFGDADVDAPVVLYEIRGGGHTIPGMKSNRRIERVLGKANRDISTTEVVWDFFRRFHRN